MEKIKAALHIHDKTSVPNDGAVGNMQNPSLNPSGPNPNEPTATELWGSGNADVTTQHKSEPINTTAVGERERIGNPNAVLENSLSLGQDDPFANAQRAQEQVPKLPGSTDKATSGAVEEKGVGQVVSASSIPEEKVGSSSPEKWAQLDPLNQPQPSAETGPGTHFRPDTGRAK